MDSAHKQSGAVGNGLAVVRARIANACNAAGRAGDSVTLVAVSKTQPWQAIAGVAQAGQQDFGENYVQEALAKQVPLAAQGLIWHFIGPIQSNKTADIASHFSWVHGIDRLKIAQRLSAQRPPQMPDLNVCLQINISDESSKSGIQPADAAALARQVAALPRLRLRGLMAIPAPAAEAPDPHASFRGMRLLYEDLRAQGLPLDTLSMGMSDDLEPAIAEGATMVRIGTAIFGARGA